VTGNVRVDLRDTLIAPLQGEQHVGQFLQCVLDRHAI